VNTSAQPGSLPPPPFQGLRAQLLQHVEALEGAGEASAARDLRAILDAWWADQQKWNGELADLLSVHHDINNALVGVRGNAQLLMMGPVSQQPGVKERLEVVLRESGRIRDAAVRLAELKSAFAGPGPTSRAA
jgi:signal transduction histidine kinase